MKRMAEHMRVHKMKRALEHNCKTKIICTHVGISRRVEISSLRGVTAQMLKDNPNLYDDISWIVYENYIAKDDDSLKIWASLIEELPAQFMIDSDKVAH